MPSENWKIVPSNVMASGKPGIRGDVYIKMPPPPPTVFAPFSRLPAELRRKIWKHALPDARVVQVDFTYLGNHNLRCRPIHGRLFPAEPHLCCIKAWEVFREHYHQTVIVDASHTHQGATNLPVHLGYIDGRRDTVIISA